VASLFGDAAKTGVRHSVTSATFSKLANTDAGFSPQESPLVSRNEKPKFELKKRWIGALT